jgi:serine/threonine protein kinase
MTFKSGRFGHVEICFVLALARTYEDIIARTDGAPFGHKTWSLRDSVTSRRRWAVKILPAHLSSDSVARQRFEREAKIISGLNHPNICTLYDVGHQDGLDFIVMEYLALRNGYPGAGHFPEIAR